jgi:beta-galactosidase/beta-glucuronidase
VIRASTQDGTYPRPQLVREQWTSLDGEWEFEHDDDDRGLTERWYADRGFGRTIIVPFAPESTASGIGDTGFHAVVWYRRSVSTQAGAGQRVLLHFGAVDHSARVWVNGAEVGSHVGGQTPFTFDITAALAEDGSAVIVVRAEDDPHDLELPRGKQDWLRDPHVIWYTRTTGIWQTVWLETVPEVAVAGIGWTIDLVDGSVTGAIEVSGADTAEVRVTLSLGGEHLATATATAGNGRAVIVLHVAGLRPGQAREAMLWSPENPVLIDAAVRISTHGEVRDEVWSYLGARTAAVAAGTFQLNGVPYFVRAVLEQGFWPQSLLTAPDDDARRQEIELVKGLGFNTARIHQKVEDPRFLYWADRLGLLIWGETAAAYDFSPRAVELLTAEWMRIVARDRSHPCVVTWVPVNESWGVQDIARSEPQRQYVRALATLTRALDPTRPVVSNDGWEHVDSDIFTVHDYTTDPVVLAERYATTGGVRHLPDRMGPQDRVLSLSDELSAGVRTGAVPVMVSEFGGISFSADGTWGYATVDSDGAYRDLLGGLFAAVGDRSAVAGFCYTQLTDTMQEANGLLTADRVPKLPIDVMRDIVTGGGRRFIWPPEV